MTTIPRLIVASMAALTLLGAMPPAWCQQAAPGKTQELEASLRSCENRLRQRRQEETGQDPKSLALQQKVDAAWNWVVELQDANRRQPSHAWAEYLQIARQAHADTLTDLGAHRSTLRQQHRMSFETQHLEQHCARLSQQLANARMAPPAPASTPPLAGRGADDTGDNILSGSDAIAWLQRHGYLTREGVPTSNFHDWQSRTFDSLDQSRHALQGVAGDWRFGNQGRIEGPISIIVKPPAATRQASPATPSGWDLDAATSWSGRAGERAPDDVNLLDRSAAAETAATPSSRPPGYVPRYEEWRTMSQADQRYYFEAMRAQQRAEHEASMAEMARLEEAEASVQRRALAAGEQRLREASQAAERARAAADAEAARSAALASGWMLRETERLLRQQADAQAALMRPPGNASIPAPVTRNPSVVGAATPPTDAPASQAARDALLQAISARHQGWKASWCPRLTSGCGIVPDGTRDELKQWTRNASKQRQIDRLWRLLDCYDACVMAVPKNEQRVAQCRRQCQERIK